MFTERFVVITRKNNPEVERFDADKGRDAVLTFKEQAMCHKAQTELIDTGTGAIIAAGNKFSNLDQLVNDAMAMVA